MPLDNIRDDLARNEIKKLRRAVLVLQRKQASRERNVIEGTGRVRAGPPAARGDATDRHPEVFIQIDTANAKATFYITTATDAAGGTFDWASLGFVTLS